MPLSLKNVDKVLEVPPVVVGGLSLVSGAMQRRGPRVTMGEAPSAVRRPGSSARALGLGDARLLL